MPGFKALPHSFHWVMGPVLGVSFVLSAFPAHTVAGIGLRVVLGLVLGLVTAGVVVRLLDTAAAKQSGG